LPLKGGVVVMVAIGCLVPLMLMVAGAVAGGIINGNRDAVWGALASVCLGLLAMLALFWGLDRIRSRTL
jgi:hypothetical protein